MHLAPPLRVAVSVETYQSRPAGTYVTGTHFLCLCESERLYACFLWGKPGGDDARALVRALATEMRPDAQRHRTYVDFNAVTGIDAESFGVVRDFLEQVKLRQKEVTEREAIVRPAGLAGTIVAGFFALYPQQYPTAVFTEPSEAATFLGVDEATLRRWEVLRDQVRGVPSEVLRLRQVLQAHLHKADLAFAARVLAVSPRTLQRRLGAYATTFQRELDAVRLDAALTWVAESDDKVMSIALRLGFASAQHFSEWFHRKAGCTAEAFRERMTTPEAAPTTSIAK